MEKSYIAIDLKAFYGSVECVERGLDPLTTNLVVADESRTQKTICLSVTPSLKKYGLSGRARLFEVIQKVKAANAKRLNYADGRVFSGSSHNDIELNQNPNLSAYSQSSWRPLWQKHLSDSLHIVSRNSRRVPPGISGSRYLA